MHFYFYMKLLILIIGPISGCKSLGVAYGA